MREGGRGAGGWRYIKQTGVKYLFKVCICSTRVLDWYREVAFHKKVLRAGSSSAVCQVKITKLDLCLCVCDGFRKCTSCCVCVKRRCACLQARCLHLCLVLFIRPCRRGRIKASSLECRLWDYNCTLKCIYSKRPNKWEQLLSPANERLRCKRWWMWSELFTIIFFLQHCGVSSHITGNSSYGECLCFFYTYTISMFTRWICLSQLQCFCRMFRICSLWVCSWSFNSAVSWYFCMLYNLCKTIHHNAVKQFNWPHYKTV